MGQLGVYFGQQVRAARLERNWSQAQLAEAAGTSEEWVRRIERGAKSPSFDTVEAISTALGVTVSHLFAAMVEIRRGLKGSSASRARCPPPTLSGWKTPPD
ncbi:helix-turn-helix transcriptional regulator [Brevundimonas sp.]|uniref:helix-turn-helix domain-containing protein n=1 Tax=Brevundimonas sp. TaxID=1871086 RepID=UPI00289C4C94|nr:helix-turn-helix transcriptional regulator [Brevundimonas sp.]